MGKYRISVRKRVGGFTAVFMIFIYAMFYIMWYSMLLALWFIYGVLWLFALPFKLIKKHIDGKRAENR